MRQPHKHAAVIKAWADGANIQVWAPLLGWSDCADLTWQSPQYRVKPEIIEYRHYLYQGDSSKIVRTFTKDGKQPCPEQTFTGFIRWISDWQRVEV